MVPINYRKDCRAYGIPAQGPLKEQLLRFDCAAAEGHNREYLEHCKEHIEVENGKRDSSKTVIGPEPRILCRSLNARINC
jgi:hypothetical protein